MRSQDFCWRGALYAQDLFVVVSFLLTLWNTTYAAPAYAQ